MHTSETRTTFSASSFLWGCSPYCIVNLVKLENFKHLLKDNKNKNDISVYPKSEFTNCFPCLLKIQPKGPSHHSFFFLLYFYCCHYYRCPYPFRALPPHPHPRLPSGPHRTRVWVHGWYIHALGVIPAPPSTRAPGPPARSPLTTVSLVQVTILNPPVPEAITTRNCIIFIRALLVMWNTGVLTCHERLYSTALGDNVFRVKVTILPFSLSSVF